MSSSTDKPKFRVLRANWGQHQEALRLVRHRVFIQEQMVPKELEWDGEDEDAIHFLALDADDRPIGAARLLPTGQIGRMAVLPQWRRQGVGQALIREAVNVASEDGRPAPFLNAQTSALPFYDRMGFIAVGREFAEAGIPHIRMILSATSGEFHQELRRLHL